MSIETNQTKFWSGEFGKNYTDRNPNSFIQMNELFEKEYGISRTQMNNEFLSDIPKNAKILEVGCNVGVQLQTLQSMGYEKLYGIELQWYAVEKAKTLTKNINIIQGSGFEIPFKDNYFDMVYTSGVLTHIHPNDLKTIMQEMARCSNSYIWGFEYYSEKIENINYRGNEGFLWKADYPSIFKEYIKDIEIIKEKKYNYLSNPNQTDKMYLLKKYNNEQQ